MPGASLQRTWIDQDAMAALVGAFLRAEGREPCGVLLGRIDGEAVRVREAPETPNVHPDAARAFRISPKDLLEVVKGGRARGLTVVGFWHGHLVGRAEPGEADVEGFGIAEALGPSARVLVIGGRGGARAPVFRAWVRSAEGDVVEIPLAT